jgi:hypothetical protein
MSLNKITKKLNVYDHEEKIDTFVNMYVNKVFVDTEVFRNQLYQYRDYVKWSNDHFNIGSFFYYDQHLENIEEYILNLPIFSGQHHLVTWQERFGIDFYNWNRMHHIPSHIGSLLNSPQGIKKLTVHNDAKNSSHQVALTHHSLQQTIVENFDSSVQEFVTNNQQGFDNVNQAIQTMQHLDILLSPPPIKKQTLAEKMHMIKNFDQCLNLYNQWITHHPNLGTTLSTNDIELQNKKEYIFWNSFNCQVDNKLVQRPIQRLTNQNDDNL